MAMHEKLYVIIQVDKKATEKKTHKNNELFELQNMIRFIKICKFRERN